MRTEAQGWSAPIAQARSGVVRDQNGASLSTARMVTGPSSDRVFSAPNTSADALAIKMEIIWFGYRIDLIVPGAVHAGKVFRRTAGIDVAQEVRSPSCRARLRSIR